jgi:trk system potassium uptake protein TrkA
MRIILVGFGRIGTQLVSRLLEENHQLVIVDKNRAMVERAARHLKARIVVGDATDPDLLREAGADKCDLLLALTRNENSNLMAAQIAKSVFRVPRVVALVYDAERQSNFQEAGIETFPIALVGAELLNLRLKAGAPARIADRYPDMERAIENAPRTPPADLRELQPALNPYYVIIVGGGKVGYYLARVLLSRGHEPTVIENNPDTFALVSNQLDCPVLRGDGSTTAILEQAGANRCNVFVSVTNYDHDNLIACQVAKYHYGIPKTIARVKNPKNESVLHKLGVDVTVSSTALISQIIESELPARSIRSLLNLSVGGLEVLELSLDASSPVLGKQVKDLTFPNNSSIVAIIRGGEPVVVRGDTEFKSRDTVLALSQSASETELRRMLLG